MGGKSAILVCYLEFFNKVKFSISIELQYYWNITNNSYENSSDEIQEGAKSMKYCEFSVYSFYQ